MWMWDVTSKLTNGRSSAVCVSVKTSKVKVHLVSFHHLRIFSERMAKYHISKKKLKEWKVLIPILTLWLSPGGLSDRQPHETYRWFRVLRFLNILKSSCDAFWVSAFPLLCYEAFLCMWNVCRVKTALSPRQRELLSPTENIPALPETPGRVESLLP